MQYRLSNGETTGFYLQAENDRNTHNGLVFIELIKRAFEVDEVTMVGHHFVFEPQAAMEHLDLTQLNEIPSADTLIFDHPIMRAVFGTEALRIMRDLAGLVSAERESLLRVELAKLPPLAGAKPARVAETPENLCKVTDDYDHTLPLFRDVARLWRAVAP